MNLSLNKCLSISIILPSLLIFAGDALGQQESSQIAQKSSPRNAKEQLVGTWKLVSFKFGPGYPMGRDAVGLLIYGADGHMSLQIMRPDRSKFAFESMVGGGTAEEAESAYKGYFAYFGTYEVIQGGRFVTHHIEGSLFPNAVGRSDQEFFKLSDDRLEFGFISPMRVIWERVK